MLNSLHSFTDVTEQSWHSDPGLLEPRLSIESSSGLLMEDTCNVMTDQEYAILESCSFSVAALKS